MRIFLILLMLGTGLFGQNSSSENLILISIDGLRWQELFSGADQYLINHKKFSKDQDGLKTEFWDNQATERRKKLLPFIWTQIAEHGQIYGNREYMNRMNLTNKHWFSYPGYSEILCGFADDERIKSNEKINNPNKTFLEYLNDQDEYKGKVAAFGSWDVFPFIINKDRNGIHVNAGFNHTDENRANEAQRMIGKIQDEIRGPWAGVRLDPFTHNYAMEYLKKNKPRVLYIAYGETDDWAHHGDYDEYLKSAHQTDKYIQEIWQYLQSTEAYKDNTTLIITTDHGRGLKKKWKHHGSQINGSDEVWMAIMGPDIESLGEVKQKDQLFSNQLAKTAVYCLGLDYKNVKEVGPVIPGIENKVE